MKILLDRFNQGLSVKFNIKSILTLVVANSFSEMRTGGSDMPLQWSLTIEFIEKELLHSIFIFH